MDTQRLCELTSAADSLQLKPLVDLTSRALARIIEGKTPEEIREIFHLPDDLTEVSHLEILCMVSKVLCLLILTHYKFIQEEKLEPLKNVTDDPRIRLLNRLYARKRKELKEREKLKVTRAVMNLNCIGFCSFVLYINNTCMLMVVKIIPFIFFRILRMESEMMTVQ